MPPIVGLSPHSKGEDIPPAVLDVLTDLEPHEKINHKTFQNGKGIYAFFSPFLDEESSSIDIWNVMAMCVAHLQSSPHHHHHFHHHPNYTGKVVANKTEEQQKLIELSLHQNSLFTCLDEEQISK